MVESSNGASSSQSTGSRASDRGAQPPRIELIGGEALSEVFKKEAAIPYFKDIYKDLVAYSDAKSRGINKFSMLKVSHQSLSAIHMPADSVNSCPF